MAGIQLIGKQHVLDAFNELDADTWALFQGKQLLVSGSGEDTLETWLDRFMPAGSTGSYTLRVYDTDLPVKAGTDYVAAFNFKLVDTYGGEGIYGYGTKLMARIEGIEKRLNGDGDSDDDDSQGITGILMGWLKEPEKLDTAIGAIMQLAGRAPSGVPAGVAQPPAGAINGFKVTSDSNQVSDDKLERVAAALDKLEKRDPDIVKHLEKFADMDALTFSFVMQKLDSL